MLSRVRIIEAGISVDTSVRNPRRESETRESELSRSELSRVDCSTVRERAGAGGAEIVDFVD